MGLHIRHKLSLYMWNVGFCRCSEEQICAGGRLPTVKWMEHPYDDRFFADPFILDHDKETIRILAEEFVFKHYKGRIVLLTLHQETGRLLEKEVVLDSDTHLSYPQILRMGGEIYICPENSESGNFAAYRFDPETRKAVFYRTVVDEPLVDPTFFTENEESWIMATKGRNCGELYLYRADTVLGNYVPLSANPFVRDEGCARPAGGIIRSGNGLYRPAQNCSAGYGGSVVIKRIEKIGADGLEEKCEQTVLPEKGLYGMGLHTLNFRDGMCVTDGYYLRFAPLKKIRAVIRSSKKK